MVMGGSSGPELHSSLCSSSTSTCGMEQSWDQPGAPQHQLLQGYKLPVPKDLLKRNRECCHLCAVPEEMQHKAWRTIQILSVEAFQFAI